MNSFCCFPIPFFHETQAISLPLPFSLSLASAISPAATTFVRVVRIHSLIHPRHRDTPARTRRDKNTTSVIVESGQGSRSNPTWRALPRPGCSQQPAARSGCLFSIPTATVRLCLLIPRQATVLVGSPKCRHRSREALPHD
ncbi:hypothetical protein COCCADRAFT_111761 [Bipolaris zeicola 26-R-13]|uniref:Uncharacterized protein n=1 Tax=Cochliobolus carbonum (strain 26-R-13) TaxID=930089 RepID=W6Y8K9_COCC2|nr:uncharacterized protein COCCADRAFT_111761 [Bipolaris zeicola 26-R-13]EUC27421.1 hypothetical protein COCCADRAFT_111761 [Bipolaris zeicola 26-R-13]